MFECVEVKLELSCHSSIFSSSAFCIAKRNWQQDTGATVWSGLASSLYLSVRPPVFQLSTSFPGNCAAFDIAKRPVFGVRGLTPALAK